MKSRKSFNLGIVFRPDHPPEKLPEFARRAEAAGFDELWLWEDSFYLGGIASAAAALANTERIAVGLGIMPAVVRNPVFAAMEIATLARLYPNRFLPGFGHGMASWLKQIGAFPSSQLAALEEVTVTVREMLAGKRLNYAGQHVQLDQVKLVHPPDQVPPILLGVRGPNSLALSGRAADGTIIADFSDPAYVSWAHEKIEAGKRQAGHDRPHRLTVFVLACAGTTTAAAREELRPVIAKAVSSGGLDAQLTPMGILPQVRELLAGADADQFEAVMPEAWIDQLAIAGTAEDWTKGIDRFVQAGAHSIILVPSPGKEWGEVDVFGHHLQSHIAGNETP